MTLVIDSHTSVKGTLLSEVESKELLRAAGVSVIETMLARTRQEAIDLARALRYPIAVKIASPDISHKSDVGGVRLGLKSGVRVGKAFDEVLSAARARYPEARIDGVSVQKMARPGVEVIVGMSRDPQFGPVLMFGLGGVFVEILKDVAFRLIPINRIEAREMIEEVKGYPLLTGYRGQAPVDLAKLEDMLLKVSAFVEANPTVRELDLNPVVASIEGAVAVDARVILDKKAGNGP